MFKSVTRFKFVRFAMVPLGLWFPYQLTIIGLDWLLDISIATSAFVTGLLSWIAAYFLHRNMVFHTYDKPLLRFIPYILTRLILLTIRYHVIHEIEGSLKSNAAFFANIVYGIIETIIFYFISKMIFKQKK